MKDIGLRQEFQVITTVFPAPPLIAVPSNSVSCVLILGVMLPQRRIYSLVKEKELETKGDSLPSSSLALSKYFHSSSTMSSEGRCPELPFRGHGISTVSLKRSVAKSKLIFFFIITNPL